VPSVFKYQEELNFWQSLCQNGQFDNAYYERTLLAVAGEVDASFLAGKSLPISVAGLKALASMYFPKPIVSSISDHKT
jgi:hypothetical protein